MASRNYSVKFSSSGLSALVNDLKTAGRTFDQTLNSVQRSIGKVQSARGIVADAATDATTQFSKVAKNETNNLLSSTKQQLSAWSQSIESSFGQQMRSLRSGFPKMVTFRDSNSVMPKVVLFNSPFKGMQTPKESDPLAKLSQRDRALVQAWRNEYRTFFTQFREELKGELKDALQKDDGLSLAGRVISAPFNLIGDAIKFPIEATLLGMFSGFGDSLSADFSKGFTSRLEKGMGLELQTVGEDVGDIVGQSVYRTYESSLKAVRKMILSQSPDKMPQVGELIEDIKKILLGSLIQSAAVPLKAHKRIQINKKALPQVMNEAGSLLINQTLPPEDVANIEKQKSITLLVGGVNNDPTAGNTEYVNRLLKPLVGDSHVVPVKNFWSNSKIGDEFKEVVVGLIKNIFSNDFLSKGAVDFLKNQGFEKSLNFEQFKDLSLDDKDKFIQEVVNFFESGKLPFGRLLESAYQGFNPDDIMIAAQALYYKQNFPDKPLNIVGTSGGGFNVAGAIEMLNKLGYKDIKGVGITTPFTGLEYTGNREDFYGSIGTKDPYYQMTFGSVLKGLLEPPDFMQIAPGVGSGHLLASYVGTPEFQNFFQYFFRDRIKVPKGMDGGAMNYISRRVQNPEDENLQRTLLQAFGVPTDAGYTFNAFELAGLTSEIKKKASRIKDKDIKKEAQTFIDFLETLAEELKIISLVGAQFKPSKSLQKAAKVYPELKELAAKNQPSTQDKALEDAVKGQLEVNQAFIQFKAKVKSEAENIKRTLQALRGEKVEGYAFYDEAEYETRANDHLGGLIGHLENDLLKGATPKQQAKAYKYLDYLKRLQQAILARGKDGIVTPELDTQGQELFGFDLATTPRTAIGRRVAVEQQRLTRTKPQRIAQEYQNYLQQIQAMARESGIGANSGDLAQVIKAIKTQLKQYRQAIANAQHEIAKNLGESLLEVIEGAKLVAENAGENVNPQTIGSLTRYQNEILYGDKGKGRAQIGLTQLAQNNRNFQALLPKDIGTNVAKGLTSGINQNIADAQKAGEQLGEAVIKGAEGKLEIKSPSRVFLRIGKFIVRGLELGVSTLDLDKKLGTNLSRQLQQIRDRIDRELQNQTHSIGQNQRRWLDQIFDTSNVNSTVDEAFGGIFETFGQFFEGLEEQFPIVGRIKGVVADLAVNLLALFGVFTAADIIIRAGQSALETARKFEQLDRVIIASSGSAAKGAANLKFVSTEAKRLSLDLEAAKSSYGKLLASAQGSALEGQPINQIFSAVGEAAVAKGLDKEGQSRAYLAISQSISKGKVSAEELRQQLAEALSGTLQTAARALGLTTQQLDKMLETGELTNDFWIKFAAQLSAENASGVSGAANTAQASITRFNNSLTEFQVAMGEGMQPAQKLGLDGLAIVFGFAKDGAKQLIEVLTALILLVGWRLVDAFLKSVAAGKLAALGITSLKDSFLKALPAIKQFLAEMILLTIAIQTWINVYQLTQDSFKDTSEYANASAKGLDNLARAYREAGKAASEMPKPPKRDRDLISRGGIDVLGVKFNLDTMYRKPLDGLFGLFGGSFMTQGAREYYDYLANAGDLMQRVRQNNLQADNSKSVVADIQKIDKQLEAVRSKRFELLPGDRSGLAKSIEDEQKLLAEREKLLKITSTISSNFARDAENIKKTIEAIDRLPEGADTDAVRSQLEQALKELTSSQNAFDSLINFLARGISELDRRMRNLNEGMAAFNEQLERNTSQSKTNLINQGIQQGRDPSKIQFDLQRFDASALSLKISKLSQDIAQIEKDLASPALVETVQNLGIDPNTVGSEQLTRMLGEGRSPQEQSALKAIQQLKSNRQQLATAQEQLASSNLQLQSTFKEFTLQLVEYYRQLWRQFEDLGVETRRAIQELQQAYNNTVLEIESTSQSTVLTNLKTALSQPLLTQAQRLLNGTNDAFEQYLNSLMGGLEKMFETAGLDQQLKQQIEAINQSITSLSTSQEDRARQWTRMTQDKQKEYTDMMRGSPNETFGGSPTGNNSESVLPVPKSPPPPQADGELPPPPNQGGPIEENAPTNLTEEQRFTLKAISIARRIGADPQDLLTLMSFETSGTLSPTVQEPEVFDKQGKSQGRARGLIQFMPDTAKNLGTSDTALAAMSRIDQLDYVLKYFQSAAKGFNFQGKGLKPLYATVFAGSPMARGSISDGYHTLDGAVNRMKREHGGKARQLLEAVASGGAIAQSPNSSTESDRASQLPLNNAADAATNQKLPEAVTGAIASTEQATQANIDMLNRKRSAITELTAAQQALADTEIKTETQLRQNNIQKYIDEQGFAVEQLSDQLTDLDDKYLEDTPEKQYGAAMRSLVAEYRTTGRQLTNQVQTLTQQKERFSEVATTLRSKVIPYLEEWKKRLEAAGDTKGAAGISAIIESVGQEANFLQAQIPKLTNLIDRYQNQLNRLPEIQARAKQKLITQLVIGKQEYALDRDRTLIESDNSLLDAQGNLLQSYGDEFGANRILKQKAIAEENLRYRQQLLDIDKKVAENPTKFTADEVDRLRQNAENLNRVNLQNINEQFKDLGQVIEAEAQGALTQFFEDIFTNTKSVGDAFRDMAISILKSIAKIAAQQVVLNIFGKATGKDDGFRGLFGKLLGHADGGLVTGEGTGTSDSIVRRLSNGEFVMRAAAVKHWGTSFLGDLNSMRTPQLAYSFDGSRGDRGNSRGVSNPTLIVNVTSPDANSFRRSESQIGRDAGELYRRSLMRNG